MNRIRVFREQDWPAAAPSPAEVRERGSSLIRAVDARLADAARVERLHQLVINANRQVGIRLAATPRAGVALRLHWALLDEPRVGALVAHACLRGRLPAETSTLLAAHARRLTSDQTYAPRGLTATGGAAGRWIDLDAVLRSVLALAPVPVDPASLRIHWGAWVPMPRGQRRVRLGSMHVPTRTIRVHRMLDDAWIPTGVIEYVVWHEVCHHLAPPLAPGVREPRIHHARFRELESLHPQAQEASAWIEQNLTRLMQRYRVALAAR